MTLHDVSVSDYRKRSQDEEFITQQVTRQRQLEILELR